jgi:UDP-glucuronate 4-epimerase
MKILVTGAAGFIGHHLIYSLLKKNHFVVGVDNLNDYYDVDLKISRLERLGLKRNDISALQAGRVELIKCKSLDFYKFGIEEQRKVHSLFSNYTFDVVINLAAQAGVRYSIVNPLAYLNSNIIGFFNILECCREFKITHLIYASSSSVYGNNKKQPFTTDDFVDAPISFYAATKKSNELMAHSYSHLYGLKTTGLRFFTVYGPYGRPDMAYFSFTKAIIEGKPIELFNNGLVERDFTYIDDVVNVLFRMIKSYSTVSSSSAPSATVPYRIYNVGNNVPVNLNKFISAIEMATGKQAIKELKPMQAGDVISTYAGVEELLMDFGFAPNTPIEVGIAKFVTWYTSYYK